MFYLLLYLCGEKLIWKTNQQALLKHLTRILRVNIQSEKGVYNMKKGAAEKVVSVPVEEYNILKEIYRTVKRQNFLLRIDEAEKNLKKGRVKKIEVEDFIKSI